MWGLDACSLGPWANICMPRGLHFSMDADALDALLAGPVPVDPYTQSKPRWSAPCWSSCVIETSTEAAPLSNVQ